MKQILLHSTGAFKRILLATIFIASGWIFCNAGNATLPSDTLVKVIKFYPNPATSYINFEFPSNIDRSYSISIYSFSGKKMKEMPVSSVKMTVILSDDFYRGIYVFQLHDKSGKLIEAGKFQVSK